jgi:hypothetical protein
MHSKLLLILALVLATGCGKKGKSLKTNLPESNVPHPNSPLPPKNPNGVSTRMPNGNPAGGPEEVSPAAFPSSVEGLKITLLPQPVANQYFVSIDWQNDPQSVGEWTLERFGPDGTKVLCPVKTCAKPVIDKTPLAGSFYDYRFVEKVDGEPQILGSRTVKIPTDREINERMALTSLTNVHRLFLGGNAVLVTEGRDVEIAVEEIIARGAVIETFSSSETAGEKLVGRSGGTVRLVAKTATGKLTIVGRGEKGGRGETGVPGMAGFKGQAGSPAEVATCKSPGMDERYCKLILLPYLPQVTPGDKMARMIFSCTKPPTHGQLGGPGSPGYPGGQGAKGGDAARLFVQIENPADLDLSWEQLGGMGGDGGPGGNGGPGGPGGDPGAQDQYHGCPHALQGGQGPTGQTGPTGPQGSQGRADVGLCVRLGKSENGNCNGF